MVAARSMSALQMKEAKARARMEKTRVRARTKGKERARKERLHPSLLPRTLAHSSRVRARRKHSMIRTMTNEAAFLFLLHNFHIAQGCRWHLFDLCRKAHLHSGCIRKHWIGQIGWTVMTQCLCTT